MHWFNRIPQVLRIILLAIPLINWALEIFIRLTRMIKMRSKNNIIGFVCSLFLGQLMAYLDLVWIILYNHIFCSN